LWFIGWCFFGFNSPEEHPRISDKERLFLSKNIPSHPLKVYLKKKPRKCHIIFSFLFKSQATPWKKIATCPPVYGIAIMHVCYNFIYYTLLTSLPTYFATILNFDLHQV